MNKSRLEAFSDGVFAIIITIMVLELRAPVGTTWAVIKPLIPMLLCYILSFTFIAIYWGNHHHLMHTVKSVTASIIWANAHLLFWLSLIPFATAWMGVNGFERITVATYGALMLICGIAYTILSKAIRTAYHEETDLTKALAKSDIKGFASVILYGASIPVALFVHPLIAAGLLVAVAIMWLIPSKEIERALKQHQ